MVITFNSYAQQTQSRFSFELNAGPSVANNELGGADLDLGGGFEGVFYYRVMPHAGLYAGWGWNKFSSDKTFIGDDMDFEETGYVFGLQFKHPVGNSPIDGFLRLGGLYNHIEIENTDGEIIEDTGHGLGFQLAGGIDIPLGGKWSITPGFKFNSLSRELTTEDINTELDLNYFSGRIGLVRQF